MVVFLAIKLFFNKFQENSTSSLRVMYTRNNFHNKKFHF